MATKAPQAATRTADPRLSAVSLVTLLPVSTAPAETNRSVGCAVTPASAAQLLHRHTALRRNRRSRDGVTLRSERSAVAGSTPGRGSAALPAFDVELGPHHAERVGRVVEVQLAPPLA